MNKLFDKKHWHIFLTLSKITNNNQYYKKKLDLSFLVYNNINKILFLSNKKFKFS